MSQLNNNKKPISGTELQKYALRQKPKIVKLPAPLPLAGSSEWLDALLVMPIDEETEKKFLTQINNENN